MGRYDFDIVIVGAGPAGSSTAMRLADLRPRLASRILLLDKAVFPRPKLCGGGITRTADTLLGVIGVDAQVPSVPIHRLRFHFPSRRLSVRRRNLFRVVRREAFDQVLLQAATERGIVVRQGEAAVGFSEGHEGVVLQTSAGEYRARMVIGADGSNSLTRSKLGLWRPRRVMQTMEVFTPVPPAAGLDMAEHEAIIDFRPVARGLQGYYWEFPTPWPDCRMISRGIGHTAVLPGRTDVALKPLLAEHLHRHDIDLGALRLRGHPIRWFDPTARHSASRFILVGDAAGTDPLFAEGITSALEFGLLAARAAVDAIDRNDYSFSRYEESIRRSRLGRRLHARLLTARHFYDRQAPWYDLVGTWASERALDLWSRTLSAQYDYARPP